MTAKPKLPSVPVSAEIRDRIKKAKHRFHANDNIAAFIEEGRRSLLDISEGAVKVTRKFDPQAVGGGNPPPPRKPNPKRQ